MSLEDGKTIQATVSIRRPVREVFGFYRDFGNMPKFLGDVMAVEAIDAATYRWTVQGPFGILATSLIRVTEEHPNQLIRYETAGPPGLRAFWEVHFEAGSEAAQTEVRENLKPPLGRLGLALLAAMGKFPAEEMSSNLNRLKQLMETGKVTDTSYSVAGKF